MYGTINDEDEQASGTVSQKSGDWFKKNVLGAAPIVGSFFTCSPQQAMKNTLRHVVLHAGGYFGMFCHMYYVSNGGDGHGAHTANKGVGSNTVAEDTAEMVGFMMLGEWLAGSSYNASRSLITHYWPSTPDPDAPTPPCQEGKKRERDTPSPV